MSRSCALAADDHIKLSIEASKHAASNMHAHGSRRPWLPRLCAGIIPGFRVPSLEFGFRVWGFAFKVWEFGLVVSASFVYFCGVARFWFCPCKGPTR